MTMSKDLDIRLLVVSYLLKGGVPRADIRHELTLDTSSADGRTDIVFFYAGLLFGIEIKSGSDTLTRLPAQRRAMGRAFDKRHVVMDTKLCKKTGARYSIAYCHDTKDFVRGLAGEWRRIDFTPNIVMHEFTVHGGPRPGYGTSAIDMLSLLWRDEAVAMAQMHGIKAKTRHDALLQMKENVLMRDIRKGVIEALRRRPLSKWDIAFWQQFDAREIAA